MRRLTVFAALMLCLLLALFGLVRLPEREQSRLLPQASGEVNPLALPVGMRTEQARATEAPHNGVRIVATAEGFTLAGVELEPKIPSGPGWKSYAKPVVPEFPKRFDGPVRVRSGVADVSCKPVGGAGQRGKIASDGSLVYENAFDGCDVQYRCSALKTEEFIVVRHAGAQREWSWDLDLGFGERALTARLTPMHSIELVDAQGVPRLRIDPPEGVDAKGARLSAGERLALKVEGNRVTLSTNAEGLSYPLTIDPSWSSTGSMTQGRKFFTLTILSDGKALAAGGYPIPGTNSAEIYNPDTGVWSATNNMNVKRFSHTAVKLVNNKVLIAGGGNPHSLNTCELYDPANESWTLTLGNMNDARLAHTATLLANGKVLVAGGIGTNGVLTSAELYDSAPQSWSTATPMNEARQTHTSALLPSGKVLLIGGKSAVYSPLKSCTLYDPLNNNWTDSMMAARRTSLAASLLGNGMVLAIGGTDESGFPGGFQDSAELYNPLTNSWTMSGGKLTAPSARLTATLLSNGRVLLAGGYNAGFIISSIYDPISDTCPFNYQLTQIRYDHCAVLLGNKKVLVAGGEISGYETTSSILF